jgi:hypothetical protein
MSGFSYGGGKGQAVPVYRCGKARVRGCSESSVVTARLVEDHLRELVLDRVRGLELEAAAEGIDLAAIDQEYDEAEAELRGFAADLNARKRLGEATWQETLTARADDRDAKRQQREQAYARSQLVDVARDVGDLDHDGLRDLLSGMVRHVFVRRRPRGAVVRDRVLVIWSDDPRVIDVPAPHRSGPFEPIRW